MKVKNFHMIRLRSPQVLVCTMTCSFLLLSAHDFSKEQQEIIDRGVEIRIEEYVKRQEDRCWERAVTAAVSQVDSMVRAGALESRIDEIVKPPRPDKPGKPLIKHLPDSLNHSKLQID
jgi:hypothetical protein